MFCTIVKQYVISKKNTKFKKNSYKSKSSLKSKKSLKNPNRGQKMMSLAQKTRKVQKWGQKNEPHPKTRKNQFQNQKYSDIKWCQHLYPIWRKPDIYFQVESNLSKYQMPESRNLGLKSPGHANKSETASRKNQTGFDRQKINNEK